MAVQLGRHVVIPTVQSLVDDATGQIPALARHLVEALHDELQRRSQFMAVQGPWRRLRQHFVEEFKAQMLGLLHIAREGRDPLQAIAPRSPLSGGLSLVDEEQALQDVALAQVGQAIEEACGAELHQLVKCFAALRGPGRPRSSDNLLRPAVFCQALLNTVAAAQLDAASRNLLIEASAVPMAQGLAQLYAKLCQQLHDAELAPLVAGHGRERDRSAVDHRRLRDARFDDSRPDQLGELQAWHLQRGREVDEPDLLARLYRQILADPRLAAPIKSLLSRLQMPVARLARRDPALLTDQQHPAWQLLNSLVANGMAFEQDSEARLHSFARYMASELEPLIEAAMPGRAHFAEAVQHLDRYIADSARKRDERGAAALAALEREEQRGPWLAVVSDQLVAQTSRAPLGAKLRAFLRLQWAEVIVQAMVLHGRDAPEALGFIALVDQLFESLHPISSDAEARALRASLPGLIGGLRLGAASIALPASQLEPVLQELMEQHGRVLRGLAPLVELPPPDDEPVMPHPQAGHATPPPETDPGLRLRRLIDETPSQMPTVWAEAEVDRAALPTVPVQLYGSADAPQASAAIKKWIDGQRGGTWYHLFVQGNWLTAQLAWAAESRSYFHFVGQNSAERHSLTRGALERLLPAGLIAVLGADCIVERAVDSLMQNLPDAKV